MGRMSSTQQRRSWNGWIFTVRRIRAVRRRRVGRGCFSAAIFGSRSWVQAWKKELLASAQRSKRRFVPLTPNISPPVYVHRFVAGSMIQG